MSSRGSGRKASTTGKGGAAATSEGSSGLGPITRSSGRKGSARPAPYLAKRQSSISGKFANLDVSHAEPKGFAAGSLKKLKAVDEELVDSFYMKRAGVGYMKTNVSMKHLPTAGGFEVTFTDAKGKAAKVSTENAVEVVETNPDRYEFDIVTTTGRHHMRCDTKKQLEAWTSFVQKATMGGVGTTPRGTNAVMRGSVHAVAADL